MDFSQTLLEIKDGKKQEERFGGELECLYSWCMEALFK
jgi:hypothetical protein